MRSCYPEEWPIVPDSPCAATPRDDRQWIGADGLRWFSLNLRPANRGIGNASLVVQTWMRGNGNSGPVVLGTPFRERKAGGTGTSQAVDSGTKLRGIEDADSG
jgi:hypothetical protein